MDIRARRRELGLTQKELGRLLNLTQSNVSRLENGIRRPRPELTERLRQVLRLDTLPDLPRALKAKLRTSYPAAISAGYSEAWSRVGRSYPFELEALRGDHDLDHLAQWLGADSAVECVGLLQVLDAGGEIYATNPHELGFCQHVVLDRQREALGDRRLPCIFYSNEQIQLVIFPQVTLRAMNYVFRLDALMLVKIGRSESHWAGYEIDGPTHCPTQDEQRRQKLSLALFRCSAQEVSGMRFLPRLIDWLLQKRSA